MPFPELGVYKEQDREVASLLSELEQYLTEVLRRPPQDPNTFYQYPAHDVNPAWVAHELHVSKERAHALLFLCYSAGIITPRYDIHCPDTRDYILSVDSPDLLPEAVDCPFHDRVTEHGRDDYLALVFFQFSPRVVKQALGNWAVT